MKQKKESRWFVRGKRRRPIEVKRRQKEDVTVTIFFFFVFLLSPVLRSFPRKTFSSKHYGYFFFFSLFQK